MDENEVLVNFYNVFIKVISVLNKVNTLLTKILIRIKTNYSQHTLIQTS